MGFDEYLHCRMRVTQERNCKMIFPIKILPMIELFHLTKCSLTHWPLGDVAVIFKLIIQNSILCTCCEITLRCLLQNLTNGKSRLDQVMAWCPQATSHYLRQCWPRSMSSCGTTRPQWVKLASAGWPPSWVRDRWVISLASRKCGCNLKTIIFKLISRLDILSISWDIALRWIPQDPSDD